MRDGVEFVFLTSFCWEEFGTETRYVVSKYKASESLPSEFVLLLLLRMNASSGGTWWPSF